MNHSGIPRSQPDVYLKRTAPIDKGKFRKSIVRTLGYIFLIVFSAADGVSSERFEVKERNTIDTAKTIFKRSYHPQFKYRYAVTPTGVIRVLRFPTPYDVPPGPVGTGALLCGEQNSGWHEVSLQGWDPRNGGLEDPQMVVDSNGRVIIAWESIQKGTHVSKSELLVKWQQESGTWSNAVKVTDDAATDISSYSIVSPSPSQVKVIWTDARERHFVGLSHPTDDGYDKVFARTISGLQLGSVERVTQKKGEYVTEEVKARTDSSGKIYAIWNQEETPGSSQIYLSVLGQSWSKPYEVSEVSKNHPFFDITTLPDGSAYIFWVKGEKSEDLYYRRFSQGKLAPGIKLAADACCPSVAVSADGAKHIIYQEKYPWDNPTSHQEGHLYYQRLGAGGWSERQEIADSVFFGSGYITIDRSDRIHIFWQQLENKVANLVHVVGTIASGDAPGKSSGLQRQVAKRGKGCSGLSRFGGPFQAGPRPGAAGSEQENRPGSYSRSPGVQVHQ